MRWILIAAAISGAASVVIGAMGAHMAGLSGNTLFETGLRYHQLHSIVLLALGLFALEHKNKILIVSAALFLAGILCFSGSLYISALWNVAWVTKLTPAGGFAFIAGWLSLVFIKPQKV